MDGGVKKKKDNKDVGLALGDFEEDDDIEEVDVDVYDPKDKGEEGKNSGSNTLDKGKQDE